MWSDQAYQTVYKTAKLNVRPKRNVVIEGNIVLIRFIQFIGIFPFSEDKDGHVYFSWTSASSLYSFVVFFVIASAIAFQALGGFKDFAKIPFDDLILMNGASMFSVVLVSTFLMASDMKNIIVYLDLWKKYQHKFQSITGYSWSLDYKTSQRIYLGSSLVMCPIISTYSTYTVMLVAKKHGIENNMAYLQFILVMYISFVLSGLWGLWWFIMRTLRDAAEDLRVAFKKNKRSPQDIIHFRRLWKDLRELTTRMSRAFGLTLVTFVLFGYLTSLISWYTLICLDLENFLQTSFLCLSLTAYITMIPEACHHTVKKVGAAIQDEILKMKDNCSNEAQYKELEIFESIINQFPPKFPFAGCYTLDRSTNISVFLSFAQALVIIYQFKAEASKTARKV